MFQAELKETKEREQRLMSEYTELEEENIALQKTVRNYVFHCPILLFVFSLGWIFLKKNC